MPLPIDTPHRPHPSDRPHLPHPATPARRLSAALASTLMCTLAGCVTLPPPPVEAPAPQPAPAPVVVPVAPPPAAPPTPAPDPAALADAAARRLLAFHERLRESGPVDLAREQARIGDAPDQPALALELALLLAQRQQPGDVARALALVEPLTRAAAPAPWQAPARLLHARLAEQRKLEEQVEKQGAQLRDQQRRLEQLAAQLEALKAIERSLNNSRPTPPAPVPTPRP
jgi:hypothetical protein